MPNIFSLVEDAVANAENENHRAIYHYPAPLEMQHHLNGFNPEATAVITAVAHNLRLVSDEYPEGAKLYCHNLRQLVELLKHRTIQALTRRTGNSTVIKVLAYVVGKLRGKEVRYVDSVVDVADVDVVYVLDDRAAYLEHSYDPSLRTRVIHGRDEWSLSFPLYDAEFFVVA